MVVPKLWARLGNQCFMIAAAIAHAKKMNTEWSIPFSTKDMRLWPNYFFHLLKPSHTVRHYSTPNYFLQKTHAYEPIPEIPDIVIEGYFQTEKYFENAKIEIQQALSFEKTKLAAPIECAIHIRRGDYLQLQDEFPVLPIEYYQEAIGEMVNKGIDKFFIFSDDIEWCMNVFSKKIDFWGSYVFYSRYKNALEDIQLMYSAQSFIIANSTFSLFPALLRDDNPLVISPALDRWYGIKNKHLNSPDLLPERFVQL